MPCCIFNLIFGLKIGGLLVSGFLTQKSSLLIISLPADELVQVLGPPPPPPPLPPHDREQALNAFLDAVEIWPNHI